MQTREYRVDGMGCDGCVSTVTEALKGVEGVVDAHVDLASGSARIEVEENGPAYEVLASAVAASGYTLVEG